MSAATPPVHDSHETSVDRVAHSALRAAAPQFFAMRAKIRVATWTEAAAYTAFSILGFAALTFVADRSLRLETAARAVMLCALVVFVVRLLWRRCWVPLRASLSDDELALAVERHAPSLRQSLISSLQFERGLDTRTHGGESQAMMREVIESASAAMSSVPFALALDGKRMGRFSSGLVGVAVLFATWAFASGETLRIWAARNLLLSGEEWPRYTQLAFVGADAGVLRLPQGDPLTITVRATGELPEQVFLRSEFERGDSGHEPMSLTGDGEFTLTMETILENATLVAEGGDGESAPLRIEIVERPRLDGIALQVVFPAYMQKEPEDVPPTEGELRIVRGSELRIRGRSTKPIASAFALLGDQKRDLAVADGASFEGAIAPDASALLTIDVIDRDQLGAGSPHKLSVRLVDDKAPSVEFKLRGIGPLVTAQVRIPGELKAKDDFGVTKVVAEFRAIDDAPQQKAPGAESPAQGAEAPKPAAVAETPFVVIDAALRDALQPGSVRYETSATIDLLRRNKKPDAETDPQNEVRPGMLLAVRFAATDNFGPGAPHVTNGEAFTFRVVTRDKLVDELRRRQVEQRMEVQKIRDDEAQAQLVLRETLSPKSDDPRAKEARLQFKQLAARQQSLGRRVALASDLYQRILWEYENNRIWEPTKVREYEALTSVPLLDLGKTSFPATARDVAGFADTGDEEVRTAALEGYDEILRRLDSILRIMEQVETLAALIEQLRGVIKVEDSAIRDVETRLKAAGESLFQKPSNKK